MSPQQGWAHRHRIACSSSALPHCTVDALATNIDITGCATEVGHAWIPATVFALARVAATASKSVERDYAHREGPGPQLDEQGGKHCKLPAHGNAAGVSRGVAARPREFRVPGGPALAYRRRHGAGLSSELMRSAEV
jgi:hypothetical protein